MAHNQQCSECGLWKNDVLLGRCGKCYEKEIAADKDAVSPEAQDELEHSFLRGEFYPDPVIG